MQNDTFQNRLNELQEYLVPYLESVGMSPDSSGKISCLNPNHRDSNPSMRLMPPENKGLWCYGCGAKMDIFDAVHILENKPDRGPEFIPETVNYLSEKFNLPALEYTLTEEQAQELLSHKVHRMASGIFRNRLTYENAEQRGWSNENNILLELGIGTIQDRDEFMGELARQTGCTVNELYDLGIDHRMFGPDRLTFCLADADGNCIGFASRNMNHEQSVESGLVVQKYLNPTHDRNILYRKSKYVYNLHRARDRRRSPTVLMVEGYADVAACELAGVRGAVAVGGTACSTGHAEALLRAGCRDVVIGMDYDFGEGKDRSGQEGTLKAIETLRAFPDIRVRVLNWKKIKEDLQEKTDAQKYDVDLLVSELGADYLRQCIDNAATPVLFKIQELQERGEDDRAIAEAVIPDIAAVEDELLVQEWVEDLSDATDYDYDLLLDKVKKQRHLMNRDLMEQFNQIKHNSDRSLQRIDDIGGRIDVLKQAVDKMIELDPRANVGNIESEMRRLEEIEKQADGVAFNPVAPCMIQCVDNDLGGGIPLYGKLLMIGGRPHVGKTALQQKMLVGIRESSPNVETLVWTLDDDMASWLQRLWSAISGLPIYKCQRPSEYLRGDEQGMARYQMARNKVRAWIQDGLLSIKDGSTGNHVAVLENWVRQRARQTNRPIIVFFDNFHKTAGASDRQKLEATAGTVKALGQELGVTFIANAELRKKSGDDDRRPPTEDDLKESGKLHYDADYLLLIDSPMQRMPYAPSAVDKRGQPLKSYKDITSSRTHWQDHSTNRDMPTLHLLRKKNKIFNSGGRPEETFYLDFDPRVLQFREHERRTAGALQ